MNNNDSYENALEKIRRDRKCIALAINSSTGFPGPTGPTERLFKSSNRIIIDSS